MKSSTSNQDNQDNETTARIGHDAIDTVDLLLQKGVIPQSSAAAATNLECQRSSGGNAKKIIEGASLRVSTNSMGSRSLHVVESYAMSDGEEDEESGDMLIKKMKKLDARDGQHPQSMIDPEKKTEAVSPPTTLRRSDNGHINCSVGPGAFSVTGIGSSGIDVPGNDPQPATAVVARSANGPTARENCMETHSADDARSVDDAYSVDDVSLVESRHLSLRDLEEATDVQALPHKRERHPKKRTYDFLCGLTLLLVLVGGVIVITLLLTRGAEKEGGGESKHVAETDEGSTTSIPTDPKMYPPFDSDLQPDTLKEISSGDPDSPRYKANLWMLEDPYLDSYPKWRKHQRFNMAVIWYSTQGDNWFRNDHWLSYEVQECSWYSRNPQPCNERGELVTQDLQANNLGGTFPMEIQMSWTKYADYSNNNLSGGLPRIIHDNKLEVIILSNNSFIPKPIISDAGYDGSMRRVIKLDSNQNLVFPSMAWLNTYPNLEVLNLTGNEIRGTLPSVELEHTPKLTYLGLGKNLYRGAIPSELGLLTKLTGLDLSDNAGVVGPLPKELAKLEALKVLDVSGTSVNGTIPIEICSSNLTLHATCGSHLQCC